MNRGPTGVSPVGHDGTTVWEVALADHLRYADDLGATLQLGRARQPEQLKGGAGAPPFVHQLLFT
jgi:hypothetical protein